MQNLKYAIVAFDADRAAQWEGPEQESIGWAIINGFNGRPYPPGRGIESIEIVEPLIAVPRYSMADVEALSRRAGLTE